jgi:hypothetical protein
MIIIQDGENTYKHNYNDKNDIPALKSSSITFTATGGELENIIYYLCGGQLAVDKWYRNQRLNRRKK